MLSELLEEYKETNDKQVIDKFTDMLWSSKYRFKKHKKYYEYKVNNEALKYNVELIKLFKQYEYIEFTFCKSYYQKRMSSIDYIRVHINNMYGLLVNKDVYLPKEYYQLLLTPKREYYNVIKQIENGQTVDYHSIKGKIEISLMQAEEIKIASLEKKIDMKWSEYKSLINTYIERLFNNYIPPHDYEEEYGWEMKVSVDGWSEDNYIIKYFCKSLSGYMRNYVASLQPKERKKKYCLTCGVEIESNSNRQKYCNECSFEREKARKRRVWHSIKHKYKN